MDESIKLIENAASEGAEDTLGELLADRQGLKPGDLNRAFFLSCKHGRLGACKVLAKAMLAIGHPGHVGEDKWEIFRCIFECEEFRWGRWDIRDKRFMPSLHVAALYERTEIIQFLLQECKIDINQEDIVSEQKFHESGETALFRACQGGSIETCRILLEAGANPNKGNWMEHEPAIYYNDSEEDGVFLSCKQKDGIQFYGCAYYAVMQDMPELLELLLQFGGDPFLNILVGEDRTQADVCRQYGAFDVAIEGGMPEVLQLLLAHVKNSTIDSFFAWEYFNIDECPSTTRPRIIRLLQEHAPEHVALNLWSAAGSSLRTAKELLDNGADVNLDNDMDESAILVALKEGTEEMCHLLIEHGADPFQGGHFISCFRHVMEKTDNQNLVQWIIQEWRKHCTSMGGSLEDDNYLIHHACFNPKTSYKAMEYLLLEEGFAGLLDKLDMFGMLPVHIACDRDLDLDVIYTLLQKKPEVLEFGGDISIVDHEKHTALEVKDDLCGRPSKRQKVSG